MNDEIKLGRYRHFKGNEYELIHIARDSEAPERLLAIYRSTCDGAVWARPLDMFLETVERDGILVPRFEYLGQNAK
ncbi:MAG: DUF1653 domain-containing protein [Clostridia bacterium]|nr:DUF1653 domain-containing protein [Clostridia bacterium]